MQVSKGKEKKKIMTIKELYELAVEAGTENNELYVKERMIDRDGWPLTYKYFANVTAQGVITKGDFIERKAR